MNGTRSVKVCGILVDCRKNLIGKSESLVNYLVVVFFGSELVKKLVNLSLSLGNDVLVTESLVYLIIGLSLDIVELFVNCIVKMVVV